MSQLRASDDQIGREIEPLERELAELRAERSRRKATLTVLIAAVEATTVVR